MRLINTLLILALFIVSACSNSNKTNSGEQPKQEIKSIIKMDELIKKAKSGDNEAMEDIWVFTLELPKWYLPCRYKENIEEITPFIGILNNMPLYFAFTDSIKAQEFAKQQGFASNDGATSILNRTPESMQIALEKSKADGVIGIYFNNGPDGWFSTTDELKKTIDSLKKKGKLK